MKQHRIGIDLGTTNTVCYTFNNRFEIIKIKGREILPSVLLHKDGITTIGDIARRRSIIDYNHVISSSKRYIGEEKTWQIEGKTFTPTLVAQEILSEVRKAAEDYFSTTDKISAVITVPAYFTSNQHNETKIAAEDAGLEVIQIISEPMAAAIAYGYEGGSGRIFVVDVGGGTFDICLLDIENNNFYEIITSGDRKLGGDDFDEAIIDLCYSRLRSEHAIDMSSLESSGLESKEYNQGKQLIKKAAEETKIALSDVYSSEISINNLFNINKRPFHFIYSISRSDFESSADLLLKKVRRIIRQTLDESKVKITEIDKVLLVGGSSYIPAIREYVEDIFQQEPCCESDLAKIVAMGAAIKATGDDTLVSITHEKLSHSLGIRIAGGKFSPIITRNTRYPVKATQLYQTIRDNLREVVINIYEGESKIADENSHCGRYVLDGIQRASARIPRIEVTFSIDKNQVLNLYARDLNTGSSLSEEVEISRSNKR